MWIPRVRKGRKRGQKNTLSKVRRIHVRKRILRLLIPLYVHTRKSTLTNHCQRIALLSNNAIFGTHARADVSQSEKLSDELKYLQEFADFSRERGSRTHLYT